MEGIFEIVRQEIVCFTAGGFLYGDTFCLPITFKHISPRIQKQ